MVASDAARRRLLPFLIVLLAGLPSQAGLFKIINRSYDSNQAAVDAAFDQLEIEVNSRLPDSNTSDYLTGVANSAVMSGAGSVADYSTFFDLFIVSASAGAGADLGGAGIGDALSGTVELSRVRGFAVQTSVLAGTRLSHFVSNESFENARLFLAFSNQALRVEGIDFSTTSYGFGLQFRLIPGAASPPVARWKGIDLTLGVRNYTLDLTIKEQITHTETSGPISASFDGTATVGAGVNIWSLPVEISTSVQLLYLWSMYAGLGTDISFGASESQTSLSGPVTLTGGGSASGEGVLDLGDSASPELASLRYFVGAQFNLGVAAAFAQYNASVTNHTLGLSLGLKAFF